MAQQKKAAAKEAGSENKPAKKAAGKKNNLHITLRLFLMKFFSGIS